MLRFSSIVSLAFVLAAATAPLDRLRADEEASFPVVLPALTNGDVNGDWELDVSDPVALLGHLFLGGPSPTPVLCGVEVAESQNGDANGDGALDLSDVVHLLGYLYSGGPEPISACGLGDGLAAAATKIPLTSVATAFTPTGPPERQWVDDEGVLHFRGLPVSSPLTGDFVGTDFLIVNRNQDPDGNGDSFGTFVWDGVWAGGSGTFEGRWSSIIGVGGDFVGQGSGDFEGMRIMGSFTGPSGGPTTHEALVLIPGNR